MKLLEASSDSIDNHARVIRADDGSYQAHFPPTGEQPGQIVNFRQWYTLGEVLCLEVASAFVIEFAKRSNASRIIALSGLNKLCIIVRNRNIDSITKLVEDDIVAVRKSIERVPSTRKNNWAAVRRIVIRVCALAGVEAPSIEPSPWKRQPSEWPLTSDHRSFAEGAVIEERIITQSKTIQPAKHPRARLASSNVTLVEAHIHGVVKSVDPRPSILPGTDRYIVFFPARGNLEAHRQDFTDWWLFDRTIASEVAAVAILKRNNSPKAIYTWRTQVRKLLHYLMGLSAEDRPVSLSALTVEQMAEFRSFIDKGDMVTRSKNWRAATSVVVHVCQSQSRPVPYFPVNPWPGHSTRASASTEPLTMADVGAILDACLKAMNLTMAASTQPQYPGVTLSDLFPFVVLLTFWTLFNPETVIGIHRSNIRPEVFGRFAIVGYKGRSATDQVATFPSTDDHPAAPKRVIANVLLLTEPLRNRLPPDKRDYLFVGLVRQSQRARAMVQAYANLGGAMTSYYRNEFCSRHGLQSFTLQRIRITGATIVNRLFGGDVKTAQVLLNHFSISTTDSYVRQDARRIEAARIADQIEKRSRFVRSGGFRDVRDQTALPQSAATPGFVCAAPFDPPDWLDQDPGMCAAYGACPTCPLASVDRLSSTSFAYVLRLRNQIRDAHEDPVMTPQRWIEIWKPRQSAIETTWLPMFPDFVRTQALENIRDVDMPPLRMIAEL